MRYPRVIAHRCGGGLAPENTLAGLQVAARLGCRGVEFDAMLSADGVPVLMHDETLDRTTDRSGQVVRHAMADLSQADAGTRHHPAFAGEMVPTLREALQRCALLGLWANVEIKPSAGREEETGARVAEAAGGGDRLVLSSFSPQALAAAARVAPQLPRALLLDRPHDGWRTLARELGVVGLHLGAAAVSKEWMADVRDAGLRVAAYTVNQRPVADRLFSLGVCAVFTDRPDLWLPGEM